MSKVITDVELRAYQNLIGSKEYHNQYVSLYNQTKSKYNSNTRHSKLSYTNDKAKLEAIKEKYKKSIRTVYLIIL